MYGLYRCAACVPSVKVGDTAWNLEHILSLAASAGNAGCALAVFPELTLSSASCGDLFRQPILLKSTETAVGSYGTIDLSGVSESLTDVVLDYSIDL